MGRGFVLALFTRWVYGLTPYLLIYYNTNEGATMEEKYKILIEIARSRGYSEYSRSFDYSRITLSNDFGLALSLDVADSRFELSTSHKLFIKLTTGPCGSFEDESHFRKFEKKMIEYVNVLNIHDCINKPNQENNPCHI